MFSLRLKSCSRRRKYVEMLCDGFDIRLLRGISFFRQTKVVNMCPAINTTL